MAGNLTDPCLPSVYLGFSGSDRYQRTFQSGYQITKINQFSLVAYYQRAASTVCSAVQNVSTLSAYGHQPAVLAQRLHKRKSLERR